MVNPPLFGLQMAHPPWLGADCYQWLCCCSCVGNGVVGVGIGHPHHGHCSSPPPIPALDTSTTQELVWFNPSPPPKPPWLPPCHNAIKTTLHMSSQTVSPLLSTVTASMSGHQKKKKKHQASASGAHLSSTHPGEYPPITHPTSPCRKGKGRKRLGLSSPQHKASAPTIAAASKSTSLAASKPNATASKSSAAATSSNSEEEPLHGCALDYNAPAFVPTSYLPTRIKPLTRLPLPGLVLSSTKPPPRL